MFGGEVSITKSREEIRELQILYSTFFVATFARGAFVWRMRSATASSNNRFRFDRKASTRSDALRRDSQDAL